MASDISDAHLEWLIDLAKKGDGGMLAALLRDNNELQTYLSRDYPCEILLEFLATVIEGKFRLPRPRRLTYLYRQRRYAVERHVARLVDAAMMAQGKQRDKALRKKLTQKLSPLYGTTEGAVARFLTLSKTRRR